MPKLASLAFAAVAGLVAASAPAQQNDRQLIIYGNDRCPSGTICVRAPESERYRIPQGMRSGTLAPADQPWAARAASVADAGAASGAGSCSSTGAGGFTGCFAQQARQARAERRADKAAVAASAQPQ